MGDFLLISWFIVALYVWFDTDAVPEYAQLFRIKFFKGIEFFIFKRTYPMTIEYPTFLLNQHDSFYTRLIACPICIIVLMNIYAGLFINFNLVAANIIFTWLGYFGLHWLIKKFNE